MHWWDFTTKSFWRLSVIKNTYSPSLMGPKLKFFRRLSAIKNTYWHALVWAEHKIVSALFSCQEHFLRCIGGTLTQNLFDDFQLSRILIDMHWQDFNIKSLRWFSAIKKTYWCELVGLQHKIFSTIFSYQEYLLTCFRGTWTQNLFGDFQLSRVLIDMHWWDVNAKSFRWISAIKKTYWHALAGF